MATWEFPCSDPIDLSVNIIAGSVAITAAPASTVTVSVSRGRPGAAADDSDDIDDVSVDFADGRLDIAEQTKSGVRLRFASSTHVAVQVPTGSRCTVRTIAADVSCHGEPGGLDIQTASGDIDAEVTGGPAQLVTISGRIQADELAAEATLSTASGSIVVRHAAGHVSAKSVSGEIRIAAADGSVSARTANGRVKIGSVVHGQADVHTVSGDVEVGVAEGTGLYLNLASVTGQVSSDLTPSEPQSDVSLRLQCRTLSGAIRVSKAVPAEMAS